MTLRTWEKLVKLPFLLNPSLTLIKKVREAHSGMTKKWCFSYPAVISLTVRMIKVRLRR